jgi:hypothetical protein
MVRKGTASGELRRRVVRPRRSHGGRGCFSFNAGWWVDNTECSTICRLARGSTQKAAGPFVTRELLRSCRLMQKPLFDHGRVIPRTAESDTNPKRKRGAVTSALAHASGWCEASSKYVTRGGARYKSDHSSSQTLVRGRVVHQGKNWISFIHSSASVAIQNRIRSSTVSAMGDR